jgi:hypothetical protein
MENFKTRFFLSVLVLTAFFSPLVVIVNRENAKRNNKVIADQEMVASVKKDAEAARYQYYIEVAQQREAGKKSMTDAKNQYDALLKEQPKLIQDNQKTVTQTTTVPVVTQKVVNQPVTTTTTASTPIVSQPKASAKTKTS